MVVTLFEMEIEDILEPSNALHPIIFKPLGIITDVKFEQ